MSLPQEARQARLVVICDPNDATRALLDEVFRVELHAYVTTLTSVSEIGPSLRESVPTLLVVEIGRDRLADVAALRTLKEATRSVPFLVLTAWGLDVDQIEEKVGAEAVIPKPFELAELIDVARQLVGPNKTTPDGAHEARAEDAVTT